MDSIPVVQKRIFFFLIQLKIQIFFALIDSNLLLWSQKEWSDAYKL